MTSDPIASVVIVNWNVRHLLRECLRSLHAEGLHGALEVMVVDNASSDGSVEMLRDEFPAVRVVVNRENEGFARANNRALPLSSGRYLVLLNPDTVVTGGALHRLVDWMEAHPAAAVAGCRLLNSDGSLQRWTGGAFPTLANVASHHLFLDRVLPRRLRPRPMYRLRDDDADERVEWVSGACMIVRRASLRGRLFDERYFMYAEDMELCERLAADRWEIWYTPSATVVHHHGRSITQQSGEVALSPVRGPRMFFARHRGPIGVLIYDILTTSGFFLRWVAFACLSATSSRGRHRTRARSNRQLMLRSVEVMRGR